MTRFYLESAFDQTMKEIAPMLQRFNDYDLVIGIPFLDEQERLVTLLKSVDNVLESWIGRRQLIVCAGDISAGDSLQGIKELNLKHPHIEFLMPAELSGRGMSVRAILEISKNLDADLLLFSVGMAGQGAETDKCWLDSLLTPIQGPYDMVLASLRRHSGIDSIAHMLAAPILESFYGCRVSDPLGGIYAIAHDFIEELAHEARFWGESISGYGIDFWLLTRALSWNKNICELNLGGEIAQHNLEKRNRIFYEIAQTIFEAIKRDSAIWLKDRLVIKVADILARSEVKNPDPVNYPILELLTNFINGCSQNSTLLRSCLSPEMVAEITETIADNFHISDRVWVAAVYNLLLHYIFEDEAAEDILSLLTAIYNGRVASYMEDMNTFSNNIPSIGTEKNELMVRKMDSIRLHLNNEFWQTKPEFDRRWLSRQEQLKPPIIPLGYMEYVPGKPVVVPKKIAGKDRKMVATDNIFKELRKRYEKRFMDFMVERLQISADSEPQALINQVENFIAEAEQVLDRLLPGDLRHHQGLQSFVDALFGLFPQQRMFTINSDLLREMVVRFPPVNLMIPMGVYKPAELLAHMDARDIVSYANLMESWIYTDRDLIWLLDNLKPESFEWVDIKPLILSEELRTGLSPGKLSNLNRVTARILVKGLEADKGGKYPKIRYFTNLLRRIAMVTNYSQLFTLIAAQRKNISAKIGNSLLGLQKGDEFSAHSIFVNYHHRGLVAKIKQLANDFQNQGDEQAAHM
ncbi:MAG: hypothetical protein PHR04_08450, partial [Syntrophomonadaceae bacterium]|nr:hypothetical protein [Syntrophomonadaceae bacterium]